MNRQARRAEQARSRQAIQQGRIVPVGHNGVKLGTDQVKYIEEHGGPRSLLSYRALLGWVKGGFEEAAEWAFDQRIGVVIPTYWTIGEMPKMGPYYRAHRSLDAKELDNARRTLRGTQVPGSIIVLPRPIPEGKEEGIAVLFEHNELPQTEMHFFTQDLDWKFFTLPRGEPNPSWKESVEEPESEAASP